MIKLSKKNLKTVAYTPVAYRGEANAPIFFMKPLNERQRARQQDKMYEAKPNVETGEVELTVGRTTETQLETVMLQLQDFKNIINEDGVLVEFVVEDREEYIDSLPGEIVAELKAVFGNGSRNEVAEAKLVEQHEKDLRKAAEKAEAEAAADVAADEEE